MKKSIFDKTSYIKYMIKHMKWRQNGRPDMAADPKLLMTDPQEINDNLSRAIEQGKPFCLLRPGNCETSGVNQWLEHMMFGTTRYKKQLLYKIVDDGDGGGIKWFAKQFIDDISETDVFAFIGFPMYDVQWLTERYCNKSTLRIMKDYGTWNQDLVNPWYEKLRGKKVLVISPFVATMKKQYERFEKVCGNYRGFPLGIDFIYLKSVWYYPPYVNDGFDSWKSALDYLMRETFKKEFDIALISCSTFSTFLGAEIKRRGKMAIQFGGELQIAFGILGKRWENDARFKEIRNDFWVSPSDEEKIEGYKSLDGGGYWG